MNKEILKPNPFFVDKSPEEYRQLSIALSYAGNRLNQLIMKKQVADYRQQNLVMKQELRKRKVIKDLSDFESFIPKAVRDELVNNDIWNTAGETAQIVQGVAPSGGSPPLQPPVARQPAPTQSPTELETGETPPLEEVDVVEPAVTRWNEMSNDKGKVNEMIDSVYQTIKGLTLKELEDRYDKILFVSNKRGLTQNALKLLATLENILVMEISERYEDTPAKRGRRTDEQMREARAMGKEDKPKRKVGRPRKEKTATDPPKPRGRPRKKPEDPPQSTGKGMKSRGRPKGSKNKKRMNLLIGSAVAGNDNNELLKIISQK